MWVFELGLLISISAMIVIRLYIIKRELIKKNIKSHEPSKNPGYKFTTL